MLAADMRAQRFELVFGAMRGEVGDLRLEAACVGRGGIDDAAAEFQDGFGPALQLMRKALRIRVQADLQQGVPGGPGVFEFL